MPQAKNADANGRPRAVRKLISYAVRSLAIIGLICIVLLTVQAVAIRYIESVFFPEAAQTSGISFAQCKIRSVRLDGIDLGPVFLGVNAEDRIVAQSIRMGYSLSSLLAGRLQTIQISGLEIPVVYEDDSLHVAGLDVNKLRQPQPTAEKSRGESGIQSGSLLPDLPIWIDRIDVVNSRCLLEFDGVRIAIPVAIQSHSDFLAKTIDIDFSIFPDQQEIEGTALLDLNNRRVELSSHGRSVDVSSVANVFREITSVCGKGLVDVDLKGEFGLTPFTVQRMEAGLASDNLEIGNEQFRILTEGSRNSGTASPFSAAVRLEEGGAWRMTLSGLRFDRPASVIVSDMQALLAPGENEYNVEGGGTWALPKGTLISPNTVTISETINIPIRFAGTLDDDRFTFEIFSRKQKENADKPFQLGLFEGQMTSQPPAIHIGGVAESTRVDAQVSVAWPNVRLHHPSFDVRLAQVDVNSRIRAIFNPHNTDASLTIALDAHNGKLDTEDVFADLKRCELKGTLRVKDNNGMSFAGNSSLIVDRSGERKHELVIENIVADLPIRYPWPDTGKPGNIQTGEIKWKRQSLGRVSGRLQQEKLGVSFHATHDNQLVEGLKVLAKGWAGFTIDRKPDFHVSVSASRPENASVIDLRRFDSTAEGVFADGGLNAAITITQANETLRVSSIVAIKEGGLAVKPAATDGGKGLRITGIDATIDFPDALNLKSAAHQELRFRSAQIGRLQVSKGNVAFQIESPSSFFIEKSRFQWCNGWINSQALKISPGIHDYDITLFCDRLDLAMVLSQLGAVKAEGSGEMIGNIPVHYDGNEIQFSDGFLCSTPKGGVIKIRNPDQLETLIPANISKLIQTELALKALSDFEYKWAIVKLNTEAEMLNVKLEFDGKPVKPLPFVYKGDGSGFIRVSDDSPGSVFQGIALDVKFTVPLNDFLKHKGLMKHFGN